MKPTRLGLIGCGAWGMRYLETSAKLGKFWADYGLECVPLIADVSRLSPTPIDGVKLWPLWEDLISWSGVDGVIIAAPAEMHYKIASVCVSVGIPTLLEKPATLSSRTSEGLLHLAKAKGSYLKVGYIHLASPAFREMKKRLDGKQIESIESKGYNAGPDRRTSALWDYASHDLSMIFSLLGHQHKVQNLTSSSLAIPTDSVATRKIWNFGFKVQDTLVRVACGNGGGQKVRSLRVRTTDGSEYLYDDVSKDKFRVDGIPIQLTESTPLEIQLIEFAYICGPPKPEFFRDDLEMSLAIANLLERIELATQDEVV